MCSAASVVSATLQPVDGSLPVSSAHGILWARILEWVATPSSGGSSRSWDPIYVSCVFCITGRFFTTEPLRMPKVRLTKVQILVLTQGITVNRFLRFRFFICKMKLSSFKKKIVYLFLAILGFRFCSGFSPAAMSTGSSLAVVHGRLSLQSTGAQASVTEAPWAQEHRLNSCGTWLSCSSACWIFLDQGLNPRLLHWQADSIPLSYQGSPSTHF